MPSPPLSSEKQSQLIQMYQARTPISEIEAALGISRPTLYKYLNLSGARNRYGMRPGHTTWDQAFDVVTDEAAYWVGLLLTDGAIVGNGRRVKLSLKIQDTPTLERFKAFVRTSAPVGEPYAGSRTVRFSSPYMCARLATLNVVPRKSYIAEAPDCLLNNRHFWRGVIDGDGSVFPNALTSPGLRLCGATSAKLLSQWAQVCSGLSGDQYDPIQRRGRPTVSDVILYGHPAMTVAHWLYRDCSPESPAMERKLTAYHEMCRMHGGRKLTAKGFYVHGRKADRV